MKEQIHLSTHSFVTEISKQSRDEYSSVIIIHKVFPVSFLLVSGRYHLLHQCKNIANPFAKSIEGCEFIFAGGSDAADSSLLITVMSLWVWNPQTRTQPIHRSVDSCVEWQYEESKTGFSVVVFVIFCYIIYILRSFIWILDLVPPSATANNQVTNRARQIRIGKRCAQLWCLPYSYGWSLLQDSSLTSGTLKSDIHEYCTDDIFLKQAQKTAQISPLCITPFYICQCQSQEMFIADRVSCTDQAGSLSKAYAHYNLISLCLGTDM